MSSPQSLLAKRARLARHAYRGLPNILVPRSPQVGVSLPDPDDPETTTRVVRPTTIDDDPGSPTTTRLTLTTVPATAPSTTRTPTVPSVLTSTEIATRISVPTPGTATTPGVTRTSTSSESTSVPATRSTSGTTSLVTSASLTTTSRTSLSTTIPQTTARVTRTVSSSTLTSASRTSLGSTSSATSTSAPSSGISTAGIFGIVAASIAGAVVVVSLVMFFLRRRRRKQDEYDPDAFRRQSVVMRDEDHQDHGSGRGGPRPPTMIERHNQNIAAFSAPTTYQSAGDSYGPSSDYGSYPSTAFAPSMYSPNRIASPPPVPEYAYASPYYNPSTQSPVGSPTTVGSYGGAAFDAQGRLARTPSAAAASVLSHHDSVPQPMEDQNYLARASVTPFQAAQYEAISRQLNIPPPKPLQQVSEVDEAEEARHASGSAPLSPNDIDSGPLVSPFEDQQPDATQNILGVVGGVGASGAANAMSDGTDSKIEPSRPSSEFHSAADPAYRVPSLPPSLPELKVMSGSFSPVSYTFPVSPSPRKGSFDVHSGRASPKVDLPPLSPVSSSPRRAQFVDGLEARAHDGHETPVEIGFIAKDESSVKNVRGPAQAQAELVSKPEGPKNETVKVETPKAEAPKRPETIYSDEDAYGGF